MFERQGERHMRMSEYAQRQLFLLANSFVCLSLLYESQPLRTDAGVKMCGPTQM